MNNIDTALKRTIINTLFGSGVLLLVLLVVVFRYYIDKQNTTTRYNKRIEQTYITK